MRNRIYYSKSQIIEGLSTSGKEFMFLDGTEYKGFYHKYVDGNIMSGAIYDEKTSRTLIPYRSESQLSTINSEYTTVINKTGNKIPNYNPVTLKYPNLSLGDYELGKITRYFLKRRTQLTSFIEIDKEQSTNFDRSLYELVTIDWKLTGPYNDIITNGIITTPGVYDTNKRMIDLKSKKIRGIEMILNNYIELSIYSPLTKKEIKERFLK